jgi:CheY-like chemotaxis protein
MVVRALDVVPMDLPKPVMVGVAATREIRAREAAPRPSNLYPEKGCHR